MYIAGLNGIILLASIHYCQTKHAGRLHRLHDMKTEVIIYDYADLNISMLAKMYGRRVSGYKAIGYEINETGYPLNASSKEVSA